MCGLLFVNPVVSQRGHLPESPTEIAATMGSYADEVNRSAPEPSWLPPNSNLGETTSATLQKIFQHTCKLILEGNLLTRGPSHTRAAHQGSWLNVKNGEHPSISRA